MDLVSAVSAFFWLRRKLDRVADNAYGRLVLARSLDLKPTLDWSQLQSKDKALFRNPNEYNDYRKAVLASIVGHTLPTIFDTYQERPTAYQCPARLYSLPPGVFIHYWPEGWDSPIDLGCIRL